MQPLAKGSEQRRRILVTGANGFVGGAVVRRLLATGSLVAGAMRRPSDAKWAVQSPELAAADWRMLLAGKDAVVHAAARAHVLNESAADPLAEFRRVNVEGTLNLARQAAEAGVGRFVFVSSIGVNGVRSQRPFRETDVPRPSESYAVSKLEAELALVEIAARTGMEVVIVRPPLVYGPNAPGNFRRLLKLTASGLPLPLGAIHNKRSFVALDNLVDLIVTCTDHPAAANQTFLVSDGEDLSTTELLKRLAAALGKRAHLLPVPAWLLTAGAALVGKPEIAQRLCGNLQVDISKTHELLGWSPPVSVDEGLRRTAEHWLKLGGRRHAVSR